MMASATALAGPSLVSPNFFLKEKVHISSKIKPVSFPHNHCKVVRAGLLRNITQEHHSETLLENIAKAPDYSSQQKEWRRHKAISSRVRNVGTDMEVSSRGSFLGSSNGFGLRSQPCSKSGSKPHRRSFRCTAFNQGPAEAGSGVAKPYESRMAQEASTVSSVPRLSASRHYENVLAVLCVAGTALASQVSLAMLPVAEKEIKSKGLEKKERQRDAVFGRSKRDGQTWLPIYTRVQVPVEQFFVALNTYRALKARDRNWIKRAARMYKLGEEAPESFVEEMLARSETRRVKIDEVSEVAVGFRPPGQWERAQIDYNFELWHTVQPVETVYLRGTKSFLSVLVPSLAAYSFWEVLPEKATRPLEEKTGEQGPSGILGAIKTLSQALAAPFRETELEPGSTPEAWVPHPTNAIRFRTASPSPSAHAVAAVTAPKSKSTGDPIEQEVEEITERVLAAKREAREWWPIPKRAAEDIAIIQTVAGMDDVTRADAGLLRESLLTELPDGSEESTSSEARFESPNGRSGESNERAAEKSGQLRGASEQTETASGQSVSTSEKPGMSSGRSGAASEGLEGIAAVEPGGRATIPSSLETNAQDTPVSTGAPGIQKDAKSKAQNGRNEGRTLEGLRAATSEQPSTSGQEDAENVSRRIAEVSPQDFHAHFMQIDGILLHQVQVIESWDTVWRIDKDGNRSPLPAGTHDVANDDVIELLLTHGQLVDLAEAADAFLTDKATWQTADRPMMVKAPARVEDAPVKVEKQTWLSELPRLVLSGVLLVALSAANKTSLPRKHDFGSLSLSTSQQQSLQPENEARRSSRRKVVLPSNSGVPDAEMQLLCDAVATMAGFWTPTEAKDGSPAELKFQVVTSRDGQVVGCRPENSAAVEQWSSLPLSKALHQKPKKKLRHFLLESSIPYSVPDEGPVVIELSLLPDGEVRARPWPELPTGPPATPLGPSSVQRELLELRDSEDELSVSGSQELEQGLERPLLVSRSTTEMRASIREYLGLPGISGSSEETVLLSGTSSSGLEGDQVPEEMGAAVEEEFEIGKWSFEDTGLRERLDAERRAIEEEFGLNGSLDGADADSLEKEIWESMTVANKGGFGGKDRAWREEMRARALLEASMGYAETSAAEEVEVVKTKEAGG